jgi:hypothetical protein
VSVAKRDARSSDWWIANEHVEATDFIRSCGEEKPFFAVDAQFAKVISWIYYVFSKKMAAQWPEGRTQTYCSTWFCPLTDVGA